MAQSRVRIRSCLSYVCRFRSTAVQVMSSPSLAPRARERASERAREREREKERARARARARERERTPGKKLRCRPYSSTPTLPSRCRCRAKMANVRQSRPDSGIGIRVEVLTIVFSLRSEAVRPDHRVLIGYRGTSLIRNSPP